LINRLIGPYTKIRTLSVQADLVEKFCQSNRVLPQGKLKISSWTWYGVSFP